MLEPLEDFEMPIPFPPQPEQFPGYRKLPHELESAPCLRAVLNPIPPVDLDSWAETEVFGSSALTIVASSGFPGQEDSVSHEFGPQGGAGNPEIRFRTCGKEFATKPPVRRMTLITMKGKEIRVVPRTALGFVTRRDVELTIVEWMRTQKMLPSIHQDKHDVREGVKTINVRGDFTPVGVWLWRGLEQIPDRTDTWWIYL